MIQLATFTERVLRLFHGNFPYAIRKIGLGALLPPGWGRFPPSRLATSLLKNLEGVEIGGSAHNTFSLNTKNIDVIDHQIENTSYASEQMRICGQIMPVDILAIGNDLPLENRSTDFVIASHVIEHFYDPIGAITEWVRVAKKYVFLIVPHKDRTFDRDRDVTPYSELVQRHAQPKETHPTTDQHWSVWRTADFVELIQFMELPIHTVEDVDDKVGNGFAIVIGDLENLDFDQWSGKLAEKTSAFEPALQKSSP